MKQHQHPTRNLAYAIVLIIISMSTIGCSTQKNTAQSYRFFRLFHKEMQGTKLGIVASLYFYWK